MVGEIKVEENRVRNVYNPEKVELNVKGSKVYTIKTDPIDIVPPPKEILPIFDLPPNPPVEEEPIKIEPIKEEPIKIILPPDPIIKIEPIKEDPIKIILPPDPIIKIEPIKEEPIKEDPIKTPIADVPPYTGGGSGGGGGGGSSDYFERGGGYGREQVFERDMSQRENIQ